MDEIITMAVHLSRFLLIYTNLHNDNDNACK